MESKNMSADTYLDISLVIKNGDFLNEVNYDKVGKIIEDVSGRIQQIGELERDAQRFAISNDKGLNSVDGYVLSNTGFHDYGAMKFAKSELSVIKGELYVLKEKPQVFYSSANHDKLLDFLNGNPRK